MGILRKFLRFGSWIPKTATRLATSGAIVKILPRVGSIRPKRDPKDLYFLPEMVDSMTCRGRLEKIVAMAFISGLKSPRGRLLLDLIDTMMTERREKSAAMAINGHINPHEKATVLRLAGAMIPRKKIVDMGTSNLKVPLEKVTTST